jgi:hypothetical protein
MGQQNSIHLYYCFLFSILYNNIIIDSNNDNNNELKLDILFGCYILLHNAIVQHPCPLLETDKQEKKLCYLGISL